MRRNNNTPPTHCFSAIEFRGFMGFLLLLLIKCVDYMRRMILLLFDWRWVGDAVCNAKQTLKVSVLSLFLWIRALVDLLVQCAYGILCHGVVSMQANGIGGCMHRLCLRSPGKNCRQSRLLSVKPSRICRQDDGHTKRKPKKGVPERDSWLNAELFFSVRRLETGARRETIIRAVHISWWTI